MNLAGPDSCTAAPAELPLFRPDLRPYALGQRRVPGAGGTARAPHSSRASPPAYAEPDNRCMNTQTAHTVATHSDSAIGALLTAKMAIGAARTSPSLRARAAASCSALCSSCHMRNMQRRCRRSQSRTCGRSPQNPHKSGSAGRLPTQNPRTRRHSPAHGGTAATMALLPLIGLYAGSAGLARLIAPVVPAATGLLLSGRSRVRVAVGAQVLSRQETLTIGRIRP